MSPFLYGHTIPELTNKGKQVKDVTEKLTHVFMSN